MHFVYQRQKRLEGFGVLPQIYRMPGGVDDPGEMRTLLKDFTDFVESEDMPKESARKTSRTWWITPTARPSSASRWAWKSCPG